MSKLRRIAHLIQSSRGAQTSGQSLVEYTLIAVLLALAVGGALAATGPAIGNVFSNVIFNVVEGQTTPYTPLGPPEFIKYVTKVAVYQQPTQAGPNGNGGGGGGGGNPSLTAAALGSQYAPYTQTSTAQTATQAVIQTKTSQALTATATLSPTSGGSALPTSDATPSATGTATRTGTPTATSTASITPTPYTANLPIAEKFDNPASVADWQVTTNGWGIGSSGRNLSSALVYAPGGATGPGNAATYVPLLNMNGVGDCPGSKAVIQFWSHWNLVDNITLILEAGNYSGVSSVTWTTEWSYAYNQITGLFTTGNYNSNSAWRRFQVDISPLACQAGMNTAFRFRVNPNGLTSVNSSWYIDDLAIYNNNHTQQNFSGPSGDSSVCDTSKYCNPNGVNVFSSPVCDPGGPTNSYCPGTSTQAEFYPGGDWSQTGVTHNSDQAWGAAGVYSGYKVPEDGIFQIAQPIDLTGFTSGLPTNQQPVVDFWTQYLIPSGHTANIEVMPASQASSSNQTWTSVITAFNGSQSSWTRLTVDLKSYDGQIIMVRFRLGALNAINQANQNWLIGDLFVGQRGARPNLSTFTLPFDEPFQNLTRWTANGSWQIDSTSMSALSYNFDPTVLGGGSDANWNANFYHYQVGDPAGPSTYVAGGAWTVPGVICGSATNCVGTDLGVAESQVQLTANQTSITAANGALSLPTSWTLGQSAPANAGENFVAKFTRKYVIQTAGTYYFMLYSTQGSRLKIGPSLAAVATVAPSTTGTYPFNSDVSTDWNPTSSGPKLEFYKQTLAAGTYYFEIDYFQTTYSSSNVPILQFMVASPIPMLHSNAAGTNYTGLVDTTVTLNGTIGITSVGGQDVYMNFQSRDAVGLTNTSSGDGMYVEVSADGGAHWVTLDGSNQAPIATYTIAKDVDAGSPFYPFTVFNTYFTTVSPNYDTTSPYYYDDAHNGVAKPQTFQAWHTYQVDLDTVFGATPTSLMIRFELNSLFSQSQAPGWFIANVHVCQVTAPLNGLCP